MDTITSTKRIVYMARIAQGFKFIATHATVLLACNPIAAIAQETEGFAEPKTLVVVASPEPGTIQEVLVRQGQKVNKGDLLVQMDTDTLLPALELSKAKAESRATLNAAKIELQLKQRRLENFSKLGKDNSSSEEILRAQADVDLAQAQVLKAEEEIRQNTLETARIEAQLARRTICSPINGTIIRIHRQPGEFIGISEPRVVSVADLSQLRIVFFPPTEFAERLEKSPQTDVFSDRDRRQVAATLDFVSPVTSADSSTVRVEMLIDNPAGQFRSGLRFWLENSPSASRSNVSVKTEKIPNTTFDESAYRR